jgi:type IV pilus assembly protein PilB
MSNKKDAERKKLARSLELRFGVPSINLGDVVIDRALIRQVPYDLARRHELLPVRSDGATLVVAMANPGNASALAELGRETGLNVDVTVAPRAIVLRAIERFYFAN